MYVSPIEVVVSWTHGKTSWAATKSLVKFAAGSSHVPISMDHGSYQSGHVDVPGRKLGSMVSKWAITYTFKLIDLPSKNKGKCPQDSSAGRGVSSRSISGEGLGG